MWVLLLFLWSGKTEQIKWFATEDGCKAQGKYMATWDTLPMNEGGFETIPDWLAKDYKCIKVDRIDNGQG